MPRKKPQTPTIAAKLADALALRRPIAGDAIGCFLSMLERDASPADQWADHLQTATGLDFEQLRTAAKPLAAAAGCDPKTVSPQLLLFAAQTYYALAVKLLLWRAMLAETSSNATPPLFRAGKDNTPDDVPAYDLDAIESGRVFRDNGLPIPCEYDVFSWPVKAPSAQEPLAGVATRIVEAIENVDLSQLEREASAGHDLLADLYQQVFPKQVRHVLGEFYTPAWLADHVLDAAKYAPSLKTRVLDPSCGSGTFLIRVIQRLRATKNVDDAEKCGAILDSIVGYDLNPIAVLSAKAGYMLALGPLARLAEGHPIPIELRDSILDETREDETGDQEQFDLIVGNPPWIGWDHLPDAYRARTMPLWKQYGLFTLSGNEARHGGAKKDVAALMLYRTADRHLRVGGRLAMVVTQTLFQTRGAGEGFRRFRIGEDGPPLEVLRVDDMADIRPFSDASNWTATLVLRKGAETSFPVPYYRWFASEKDDTAFEQHACLADPIDPETLGSPWLARPANLHIPLVDLTGPSDYEAHLGANTAGANGVYWLHLLDASKTSVTVRNMPGRGKRAVPVVEREIEPDLVYPLIRWADVGTFRATPSAHIVMPQDFTRRIGLPLDTMQSDHPKTLGYLETFREWLEARAAYRRYQEAGPFYSMYNVGPYTAAVHRVVWRRMDRRIRACVLQPVNDPHLGLRPPICQETCVLIAADSADEAYYLAAVLNSSPVNFLAMSHSVRGGKGFGSPGMLDHLAIERFKPWDARHQKLAAVSREAHDLRATDQPITAALEEIDLLAGRERGLSHTEIRSIRDEANALAKLD